MCVVDWMDGTAVVTLLMGHGVVDGLCGDGMGEAWWKICDARVQVG